MTVSWPLWYSILKLYSERRRIQRSTWVVGGISLGRRLRRAAWSVRRRNFVSEQKHSEMLDGANLCVELDFIRSVVAL